MKNIKDYIITIPDFPKPGIMFRDVTSLIRDPEGFKLAVDGMVDRLSGVDFDSIACLESRGFLFAAPIAHQLGKGLVLVRKKGKLPRATVSVSYDLEYGSATVEIHKDDIKAGDRVVVIDDLIATGGSAGAACSLVEKLGGSVVKCLFLIELPALGGRQLLNKYSVDSLVCFDGE